MWGQHCQQLLTSWRTVQSCCCCSGWSITRDRACSAPGTDGQLLAHHPPLPPYRGMLALWKPLSTTEARQSESKYCPNAVLSQYFGLLPGLFDDRQRLEVTYLSMMAAGAQEAASILPCHCSARFVCRLSTSITELIPFSSLGAFCLCKKERLRKCPILLSDNSYF